MFTRSWVISDLRDSDLSFQMWSHPKSRIKSVSTPSDYLSFLLVGWHANSYILLYIKKRNTGGHTCEYRFLFFFCSFPPLFDRHSESRGRKRRGRQRAAGQTQTRAGRSQPYGMWSTAQRTPVNTDF